MFRVLIPLFLLVVLLASPAAAEDPTIQFRLTLNTTSYTTLIPGTGEKSFSQLPSQTFTGPEHFFLSSSDNQAVAALVHSQREPVNLRTEKTDSSHRLVLSQRLPGSQAFLVFSSGSHQSILNRIEEIESGKFLSRPYATFSSGPQRFHKIAVLINMTDLALQGNGTLHRGVHTISIETNTSAPSSAVVLTALSS